MERVRDILKIAHLGIDPDAEMAINCEWVSDSGSSKRDVFKIRMT